MNSIQRRQTPFDNRSRSSRQDSTIDRSTLVGKEEGLVGKGPSTEHLIRKIFTPNVDSSTNWRDILPKLCSCDVVDVQLYAFIGLILRQFVQSWYYRIADDPQFIYDITQVIAHISRLLEERLVKLDITTMLLDDIPFLLETHIKDYRNAQSRAGSSFSPAKTVDEVFHNMQSHPALHNLESEQLFLRLLAKGITGVLLDEAGVHSEIISSLVTTVVKDLALVNAVEKLSEPWMLYEILSKLIDMLSDKSNTAEDIPKTDPLPTTPPTQMPFSAQVTVLYTKLINSVAQVAATTGKLISFFAYFSASNFMPDLMIPPRPVSSMNIFSLISNLFEITTRKPLMASSLIFFSGPLYKGKLLQVSNR